MTIEIKSENGIAHYEAGFTDYEAEILCITIDHFGSGEHPCASPGNNGSLTFYMTDNKAETTGVGLKGFGVNYIIEVCESALGIWSGLEDGGPTSVSEHPLVSADNDLNPQTVLKDAVISLKAAL